MNWNFFRMSICLASVCFFVGCGPKSPTVSGKITYDGKPLANVRVVFNPIPGEDSEPVGPYSVGITDETGTFSLKTRKGKPGAIPGRHKVGFYWSDIKSYSMEGLERSLGEAKGDPEREAVLNAKIADVKQKLASRPTLKADLQTEFTVPDGGTDEANFELTNF